jgi:uncharacterized protein (TIGR03435 family)
MMRAAAVFVCVSAALQCQPVPPPRFEVASIKPSNAATGSSSGIKTGHGQLDGRNVTLKRCLMGAYGVGPSQIYGGPAWLDSDRFEIAAKTDQPADDDAILMRMLQSLLAERFQLALHRETRPLPAFVLEVSRNGPKLEKSPGGESATNSSNSNTGGAIDARNTSMDLFATVLARQVERPVVNRTGLDGVFNFKLQWTPEHATTRPGDAAAAEQPSLFTAIQEQLGLRLRAERAPVEVLVIDHVEKPSEN